MMPPIVNEVLGFILAIGILLWLGAAPVIALRSLKTVVKPKKVKKAKTAEKKVAKTPKVPANVIPGCSPEYEINDNFSWNNEHSRSKRKRLLHR